MALSHPCVSLNYVNYVMKESSNIKVYLAHIIEWTDDDESMDEEMTIKDGTRWKKNAFGNFYFQAS